MLYLKSFGPLLLGFGSRYPWSMTSDQRPTLIEDDGEVVTARTLRCAECKAIWLCSSDFGILDEVWRQGADLG